METKGNTIIFSETQYLTVEYIASKHCISFNWKNFFIPLERLQIAHHMALNFAEKQKVTVYIANTGSVDTNSVLKKECLDWWGTWIAMMSIRGIRKIITVIPKSSLQKMTTKSWQSSVQTVQKIELHDALTLDHALNML